MNVDTNRYNNSPTHSLYFDREAVVLISVVFDSTAPTAFIRGVNGRIILAEQVRGISCPTFSDLSDVPTWESNDLCDFIPNSPVYLGG